MINLAVFASGEGTNAENLFQYFANSKTVKIKIVVTNKSDAGVIARAEKYKKNISILPKYVLENNTDQVIDFLQTEQVDFIVLAGFLLKIPKDLISAFPNKIINIHPSLLPKFGGAGMYGHHVHEAVLEAKESQSGITIHYVNEEYDKGEHILQAKCDIDENETLESLSKKIRALEFEYLPKAINLLLEKSV